MEFLPCGLIGGQAEHGFGSVVPIHDQCPVIDHYQSVVNRLAHSAHLAGGLAGYLYGLWITKNPGVLDGDLYSENTGGGGMMPEIKARLRRRTMRLLDEESPDPAEVNRILEKISSEGIESISSKEREILEKASEQGRFG